MISEDPEPQRLTHSHANAGVEATQPDDATQIGRELERLKARCADLVERSGCGTFVTDVTGRVLEANRAFAVMLGRESPDELIGLDLTGNVYLDPDEAEGWPAVADEGSWLDARWRRRDGTPVTVRVSVRALRDARGQIDAYDGLVEDVTERERHDELRRRSERMASLGTALAGVAHELNNPLAAIMGFAQLMLRKSWPPEDRSALETINHEAIRTATIVKDLLALARKRDVERRVPTNVNDVAGYVARTRRYALDAAGIACSLDLDPALPAVYGDRAQLEQVLFNLMSNAEHALTASAGGTGIDARITIRTRRDDRDVIVEVEDNGPGVPSDERTLIWDPFWTTKTEGEGTGLGLAVVHGIVENHGGSIVLDSAVQRGARFVIRLPIATGSVAASTSDLATRPLDVLVVDPGASDLMFVERFLTSRGHAVINAGSGELAVRLANQAAFDAMVCDARLIGRDGVPVAAALRASTGGANARLVLSATTPIDARALPPLPPGAVLVGRPYDVEELRRLIEGDT